MSRENEWIFQKIIKTIENKALVDWTDRLSSNRRQVRQIEISCPEKIRLFSVVSCEWESPFDKKLCKLLKTLSKIVYIH